MQQDWLFLPLYCGTTHPVPQTQQLLLALEELQDKICSKLFWAKDVCSYSFHTFTTVSCDWHLRPVLILTFLVSATLLICALAWSSFGRFVRYYTAKHGSAFVAVATAAIKEMRAKYPALYQPTPHAWTPLGDPNAPVVCMVCMNPVLGHEGQSCEHCSVVVHNRCLRYTVADCRPLAVHASHQPHDWRPAGVLLPLVQALDQPGCSPQVEGPATLVVEADLLVPTGLDGGEGPPAELCIYCQEPCEVGLFAVEPVWTCTCCRNLAHMRCYVGRHPATFSRATQDALRCQLAGLEAEMAAEAAGQFSYPGSPRSGMASPQKARGREGPPPPLLTVNEEQTGSGRPRAAADTQAAMNGVERIGGQEGSGSAGAGAGTSSGTCSPDFDVRGGASAEGSQHGASNMGGSSGKKKGKKGSPACNRQNLANHSGTPGGEDEHALDTPTRDSLLHAVSMPAASAMAAATAAAAAAAAAVSSTAKQPHPHSVRVHAGGKSSRPSLETGHETAGRVPSSGQAQGRAGHADGSEDRGIGGARHCRSLSDIAAVEAAAARQGAEAAVLAAAAAAAAAWSHDVDVCQRGPASRMALPSTAVRAVRGPDLAAATFGRVSGMLGHAAGRKKSGSSASFRQQQAALLAKKKRSWWRREQPGARWLDYRIDVECLPPGCRPLLVFVNLKSGPQVGASLKRQLLQLLHPMQVVELPREKPDAALRCFLSVPHLRILVVGGDGTAGWVLSTLDTLREEHEAAAAAAVASGQAPTGAVWRQPPVAIFPMGTGNDLARCLNWGGGVGELMQKSLPVLLGEVMDAAPSPLDRWNVTFTPVAPPRSPATASAHLKRVFARRSGSRSGKLAAAWGHYGSAGARPEVRVLNNYIGIGIDAKVALEFHHYRDRYPSWFQSQFGNKMWYTGVGGLDLMRRSCAQLYKRLTVLCDGVEVQLPPDAEGLLVMNIGCHMGGVFMWETGLPAHPIHAPGGDRLTHCRKQCMHDEVLEVVAIGGVLHMGRLAVGLSRAQRLCQCSSVTIVTKESLPMQIDGEPWTQGPSELVIGLKGRGLMLRRLTTNGPAARAAALVQDVLEASVKEGTITESQRHTLSASIAAKLEPLL